MIRGWHHASGKTRSFKITDFASGVAAKAGGPRTLRGIVSIAFFAAVDGSEPMGLPADEPKLSAAARGELATGMGATVEQNASPVQMTFGALRDTIFIRYTDVVVP